MLETETSLPQQRQSRPDQRRQSRRTIQSASSSSAAVELPKRQPKTPVESYAWRVLTGRIVAGPYVRLACERHFRDLENCHARGLYFDPEAAQWAIDFFAEVLCLAGGQFEGKPFVLHESQAFIVGSLFGWKRHDGTRRFRRAYIEIAKGNGKSPLAAGIGIIGLCADNEPRAEIYAAAAKKDQAMVLFRDAVAMVDQSPELRSRILKAGGDKGYYGLIYKLADSFFRPIANDDSQSGPRPHIVLVDELHEIKDKSIIELLERGFKWRRQPLLVQITNSGSDLTSLAGVEHMTAVKIVERKLPPEETDEWFSFVCGLDPVIKDGNKVIRPADDPLTDPSCWPKANPLLDVTVTREYLASVVRQARSIPGKLNNILRLHFCQWTNADTAWLTRETIEGIEDDFDPYEEHDGAEVYLAVDLASVRDRLPVAHMVKTGEKRVERELPEGGTAEIIAPMFDAWIESWTPRDTLAERALEDQAPYEDWYREGYLRAVPGQTIRFDYPAAHVVEIASTMKVLGLAYDAYAYRRFQETLDDMQFDAPTFAHPQGGKKRGAASEEEKREAKLRGEEPKPGLWMPGSISELELMILERRVRLRRSPVVRQALMSVVFSDADDFMNRWFVKKKATNRIDEAVALAMVAGIATRDVKDGNDDLEEAIRDAVIIK